MGNNTNIEWADHTFNPWVGCGKVGWLHAKFALVIGMPTGAFLLKTDDARPRLFCFGGATYRVRVLKVNAVRQLMEVSWRSGILEDCVEVLDAAGLSALGLDRRYLRRGP